jgi:hypothetical protein
MINNFYPSPSVFLHTTNIMMERLVLESTKSGSFFVTENFDTSFISKYSEIFTGNRKKASSVICGCLDTDKYDVFFWLLLLVKR